MNTSSPKPSAKATQSGKRNRTAVPDDRAVNRSRKVRSPLPYTDLQPEAWRDYPDILTDSLWVFPGRERQNGHQLDYHGNCIPQILTQLLTRFTCVNDVVLDLFAGSGTAIIEAANLHRRAIGVELKPDMVQRVQDKLQQQGKTPHATLICADSSNLNTTSLAIQQALQAFNASLAQFVFLHPPYDDIIRFSDDPNDLSNASNTQDFLDGFERVCQQAFNALQSGHFAALVIGDKYAASEWVPLGFMCLQRMNAAGFKTKSIIVKNISGNEQGKGRTNNLWRYRALKGGFYLFKHEYVMLFQKP
jgi:16S rRNA G966 N2-methylase RsmD